MLVKIAAISKASVQDVVSKAEGTAKRSLNQAWHFFAQGPFPEICPLLTVEAIYSSSLPAKKGLLKGMVFIIN